MAWLVWAYLGLYPAIPGTKILVLSGPYFTYAEVRLANGAALTIRADGADAGAPYIQSLQVGGTPTTRSWLSFGEISDSATLEYTMGAALNEAWGSSADNMPPSFPP